MDRDYPARRKSGVVHAKSTESYPYADYRDDPMYHCFLHACATIWFDVAVEKGLIEANPYDDPNHPFSQSRAIAEQRAAPTNRASPTRPGVTSLTKEPLNVP